MENCLESPLSQAKEQPIQRIPKRIPLHTCTLAYIVPKMKIKTNDCYVFRDNSIALRDYLGVRSNQKFEDIWKDLSGRMRVHNWKGVKKFKLQSSTRYTYINNEMLQTFSSRIVREMPDLNNFALHNLGDPSLTIKVMQRVCESISHNFRALKHASFRFNWERNCKLEDLKIFLVSLCSNPTSLESLDIHFRMPKDFDNKQMGSFAAIICRRFVKLKKLRWSFSDWDIITDPGVLMLAKEIATHLTSLEELNMDFSSCHRITYKGLQGLASKIGAKLPYLQRLRLNFKGCVKISYKGLDLLQSLQNLSHLSLNFDSCYKLTDNGLGSLGSAIAKYAETMIYLDISFGYCKQLTNKGLEALVQQIGKRLGKLVHLKLDFTECSHVTDQALESVSKVIGNNMKMLKHLSLIFARCFKLSDATLKSIGIRIIQNLINLNELELSFAGCDAMTDEGFETLTSEILSHLSTLQNLTLLLNEPDFHFDLKLEQMLRPYIPTVMIK